MSYYGIFIPAMIVFVLPLRALIGTALLFGQNVTPPRDRRHDPNRQRHFQDCHAPTCHGRLLLNHLPDFQFPLGPFC